MLKDQGVREAIKIGKFCWENKWTIIKFRLVTDYCDDCRAGYCKEHMKWLNDIITSFED